MTKLGHKLVGLNQICNYTGFSRTHACDLLKSGKIAAFKNGSVWNSDSVSCDVYLNRKDVKSSVPDNARIANRRLIEVSFNIGQDRKTWLVEKAKELDIKNGDLMRLIIDEAIKNM